MTTEPPPPAGGFGASPGPDTIRHLAPPPARPVSSSQHLFVLIFAVLVGTGIAFTTWAARRKQMDERAAEARNTLGSIAKDVAVSYRTERGPCPSAGPIPASFERVRGRAYASCAEEWRADPGWSCLKFELREPQHYQYRVDATEDLITISAAGDYDGDGKGSSYTLIGHVDQARHIVMFDPVIRETNPGE